MRSETLRLQHEQSVMKEKIRDNGEKIKQNKVLPYLVGNVVEVRCETFYFVGYASHNLPRFWMLTQKSKRTAQIRILIPCARENALLSKLLRDKPFSFLSSV